MTRVHHESDTKSSNINLTQNEVERDIVDMAIESEKLDHESKSEHRIQIFKDILSNTSREKSTFKYPLYGLSGILITLVTISPITLIPMHDIFRCPSYWYETPLQHIGVIMSSVASGILSCSYWMNIGYIKSFRHYFVICTACFLGMVISYTSGYMVWTYVLRYNYPIPLNGSMYWYSGSIVLLITLWFRFPPGWRDNPSFRKRLNTFMIVTIFSISIDLHYQIIQTIFVGLANNYEWVIAILLPFIRELEYWIMKKLAHQAACGDIEAMKITIAFGINMTHSVFLAYFLGSIASDTTSLLVLIFDLLFNISTGIRITWWARKNPEKKEKIIELLQGLVIVEMVEFIVPLVFLVCFCAAYYGPNAHLLGNIGNGDFHYVAVEDFGHTVRNVCLFFVVDLLSCVTCSLIIWLFCRINLFRVYTALQKEFGLVFLSILVTWVSGVSYKLIIQNNVYRTLIITHKT